MIEVQVKAKPEMVFYYETFDQFHDKVKEWYWAVIDPSTSAMEYILQKYNVRFHGCNLEA
mgnify:CR=1 FL=1